jgi:hypothetical protein
MFYVPLEAESTMIHSYWDLVYQYYIHIVWHENETLINVESMVSLKLVILFKDL